MRRSLSHSASEQRALTGLMWPSIALLHRVSKGLVTVLAPCAPQRRHFAKKNAGNPSKASRSTWKGPPVWNPGPLVLLPAFSVMVFGSCGQRTPLAMPIRGNSVSIALSETHPSPLLVTNIWKSERTLE